MSADRPVGEGLAAFLSHEWGRPVSVTDRGVSTAGARRRQVLFDADDGSGSGPQPFVATIVPNAEIQLSPVTVEAGLRLVAEEAGVITPHIHAVCEDTSYVGGPFFVSTRVEGETVPRRVMRLVAEQGNGDIIAGQLGTSLARLHAIDPTRAPAGLPVIPDDNPAVASLAALDELMRGLLAPRPAIAMGMRWLERRLPSAPPKRTIVHADCRNGNLIIGPDGLRGILDWEGSKNLGDPMEDLAWPALRMWRFREDAKEIGGFASREPFVAGYEAAGGVFDPERFHWWKVYGTLKWSLGLAGQAAAHLDGRYVTIVMAASGRRVSELEWDLLMLIRPH